jgi:ABC-2 type transport system permease protein
MTAFLALIQKDIRIFFQDRRAVIMSFVAPILIGSFFGYVFGGMSRSSDPARTTLLVVDQEQGTVSKEIIAKLSADKTLAVQQKTLEEARELVRRGKAPVAVVIPTDFGKLATQAMFTNKDRPKLLFYVDPSHQMESSMIKGMLTGSVMQAVSKEAFSGDLGKANIDDSLKAIESSQRLPSEEKTELKSLLQSVAKYNQRKQPKSNEQAGDGGFSIPFDTAEEAVTAQKGALYNPYAHSFGGMAIQFILFLGIDVGIGMLLDRQRGLWKRFASAPLSKWTLLGSRVISATLIVMLILAVVFTFARIAFGVKIEGSLPGFVAVAAAFGLMTSTYGLLIAALGKTPQAARGLSVLATLLMVMLSGAWIPSALFPGWLQNATKLVPARWAMDGLDGMSWRGLGWQEAVLPVLILTAFAMLFGTIAVFRFRWEAE